MRLLKENAILSNLRESEAPATGLTIKEVTEKLFNGYLDIDVTDKDIDMLVAFVYETGKEPEDEYDRFIENLATRTKVVRENKNSPYGDILICDFSSVFKPYNEELMNVFDMNNSEFNEDEAYYEAVLNLEGLIPGMAGESTYKELNDILEGKGKKLEPVNQFNHKQLEEEDKITPINPDDKDYYNGKLFKVGLYSGAGYELTMFKVYADNEEEALCLVVAECERKKHFGLIYPVEEIKEFVEKDYKKEFDERYAEQSDSEYDWFAFAEEYLSYVYVDATMEGASQPYFVHGENLRVEEVNDMKESLKENYMGVKDAYYINRGNWSDGAVRYRGFIYNAYEIQEALADYFEQDLKDNGKEVPSDNTYFAEFDKWIKENPDKAASEVESLLYDYTPESIDPNIVSEIENEYNYKRLVKTMQSWKTRTDIPEETIDEWIKMAKEHCEGNDFDEEENVSEIVNDIVYEMEDHDNLVNWFTITESVNLKESSYANNKLLDAVKDYGIVSVNLDETNCTITFRVPRANKNKPGTTVDPDYDDGYVCATVDFIDRVESALREMGMDVDVFGEGESATDFGTFTLTYDPKAKGTYPKISEGASIPRNASKIKIGDDEYFKDGNNWGKTSEKDLAIPRRYPSRFLRGQGDVEVIETDDNYKPRRTKEYKVLQGRYENRWEDLVSYDTSDEAAMKDLRQNVKDYRENEPNVPHRVITRREPLDEEVTESKPEPATKKVNSPGKVRNYLNYELEDDDTETGGISFNGETVADFIASADMSEDDDLDTLNKALVSCGIRPISEGYLTDYRGDDYWDLSDEYVNGNLSDKDLAWELVKLYDSYDAAVRAFKEITDGKEMPSFKEDFEDIREITPEESSQIITDWDNDRMSVAKGRYLSQSGDKWIAIDNRTGDCWVEEFNNKGSAIDYLEDRIDGQGNPYNESAKIEEASKRKVSKAWSDDGNSLNIREMVARCLEDEDSSSNITDEEVDRVAGSVLDDDEFISKLEDLIRNAALKAAGKDNK